MKKNGEQVPHQQRYPFDRGADVILDENTIPTSEINSNATFPMPKPQQGQLNGAGMTYRAYATGKKVMQD